MKQDKEIEKLVERVIQENCEDDGECLAEAELTFADPLVQEALSQAKQIGVEEERERIAETVENVKHDCDDPYVCGCMEVRDTLLQALTQHK